ncbi:MAG TPA: Gfo/Idh/MocA family oxidoreductase [Bryobacteraceae bacterium]|nr:Gfo/Idh/MocA family oxidoreductase [Bryobacteraceae bacterium]
MEFPTSIQTCLLPRTPRPITIVGAGGIVKDGHLPAYRKAGFPVDGICDLNPERARALADEFGIPKVYSGASEAFRSAPADGIFDIATPPSAFLELLAEVPAGSAVLLQKPMGQTIEQARAILNLCRGKGLTAAVNFQLRYAPNVLAARALIEQGIIGELHDMEVRITVYTPWHLWSFLESQLRMEILLHSIHYLDLMRSFLGEPRAVWARTLKHPSVPKLASARSNLILDYGEMLRANITTNHGHCYGFRHQESYVKWEGTKGAIKTRLGLLMDYPKGVPDEFEYCVLAENAAPEWQTLELHGSWFPDGFIGTMASLMRYVEGSATGLPTSVEDAIHTMELVEAAYASNASGGTPVVTE